MKDALAETRAALQGRNAIFGSADAGRLTKTSQSAMGNFGIARPFCSAGFFGNLPPIFSMPRIKSFMRREFQFEKSVWLIWFQRRTNVLRNLYHQCPRPTMTGRLVLMIVHPKLDRASDPAQPLSHACNRDFSSVRSARRSTGIPAHVGDCVLPF